MRYAKNEKTRSPYAKYGKSPFRYSEEYYAWVRSGHAPRQDAAHRERFGIRPVGVK